MANAVSECANVRNESHFSAQAQDFKMNRNKELSRDRVEKQSAPSCHKKPPRKETANSRQSFASRFVRRAGGTIPSLSLPEKVASGVTVTHIGKEEGRVRFSICFRDVAPRKHSFRAIVLGKMLEETNPQRLLETQDKEEEKARADFFGKTKAKFPSSPSFA